MRRRDIFRETKVKIIAISTAIVFLSLVILAILTQFLYTSRVFKGIDEGLIKQRNIMELNNKRPFNGGERFAIPPVPPNVIMGIYDESGKLIYLSPNAYFTGEEKLPEVNNTITKVKYDNYNFRAISAERQGVKVNLYINIDSELQSINELMSSLIIGLIILIVVAITLSAFLASKIIKPLKESYDKQVFFVQDASHEMRTPLAIIKGKVEILAKSYDDTIDMHFEQISEIMGEIKGLEKLNSDLLLLSKEDIDGSLSISEIELHNFIDDIGLFYEDLGEIQGKNFTVIKPKERINVKWDYNKVRRIIIILLENAFKYTKEEGEIKLIVEDLNKYIRVRVKDSGIGISEEDKERIFDRFYRSSSVRANNINGSGIGLSLLKSIAKTLSIKVTLNSKIEEGSEFILMIPKNMI